MESTGKTPRKQLATKVTRKSGTGVKTVKPHQSYAIIAMREIVLLSLALSSLYI